MDKQSTPVSDKAQKRPRKEIILTVRKSDKSGKIKRSRKHKNPSKRKERSSLSLSIKLDKDKLKCLQITDDGQVRILKKCEKCGSYHKTKKPGEAGICEEEQKPEYNNIEELSQKLRNSHL
ncbi:uncharacterized protein LOC123308464 isoform X2 [Coccinella septempunctata]|uniref:uncharacterized protein LOC123308464 isoform X2 n=1 Tax=Coccinella septempunctata TaxID=41139 RepID=UPI001D081731|nr:uncharacterized protein LOC123308464 isoform X2 [Coccinella septempunctata]